MVGGAVGVAVNERMRLGHLEARMRDETGFVVVGVSVFLVGVWFVRSGVIANAGRLGQFLQRFGVQPACNHAPESAVQREGALHERGADQLFLRCRCSVAGGAPEHRIGDEHLARKAGGVEHPAAAQPVRPRERLVGAEPPAQQEPLRQRARRHHEAQRIFGERDDLVLCDSPEAALEGADALVLVTEWKAFWSPDFTALAASLRDRVLFDGRNLYPPADVEAGGLAYYGIGRGRTLRAG